MRYLLLVLLNVPIILLALVNIVTQYKMGRISLSRFRIQIIWWLIILVVLTCSFPAYNLLTGSEPFRSSKLSSFDIMQTTAIVYMIYILNTYRRKLDHNEKLIRDLHQELSIRLSNSDKK